MREALVVPLDRQAILEVVLNGLKRCLDIEARRRARMIASVQVEESIRYVCFRRVADGLNKILTAGVSNVCPADYAANL